VIEQSVFTVRGATDAESKSGIDAGARSNQRDSKHWAAATNGDKLAPQKCSAWPIKAFYKAKSQSRNCTITARLSKSASAVQEPSMRVLSVS